MKNNEEGKNDKNNDVVAGEIDGTTKPEEVVGDGIEVLSEENITSEDIQKNIQDKTKPVMKTGRPPRLKTAVREKFKNNSVEPITNEEDETIIIPDEALGKTFRKELRQLIEDKDYNNVIFHLKLNDAKFQLKGVQELLKDKQVEFVAANLEQFNETIRPKIVRMLARTEVGQLILNDLDRKVPSPIVENPETEQVEQREVNSTTIKKALNRRFLSDMDFAIKHLHEVEGEIDSDSVIDLVGFLRKSYGEDGVGWLVSVFNKIKNPNLEIMEILIKGKKAKLVFDNWDRFKNLNYKIIIDLCVAHDAADELAKNVDKIDDAYHNYIAQTLVTGKYFDALANNLSKLANLKADIANALMKNGYLKTVVKNIRVFDQDVHLDILEEAMNYFKDVGVGAVLVDNLGEFNVDDTVCANAAADLYTAGWVNAKKYLKNQPDSVDEETEK